MVDPIKLRQDNPEDTSSKAQYVSPNEDVVCASYIVRAIAEQLGMYASLEVEDSGGNARLSRVTSGYAVYDTPDDSVTGLYISHDFVSDVTDGEYDDENPPESLDLTFAPSSEGEFEQAEEEEDLTDSLLADTDDSDESEAEDSEDESEDVTEEILNLDDDEEEIPAE